MRRLPRFAKDTAAGCFTWIVITLVVGLYLVALAGGLLALPFNTSEMMTLVGVWMALGALVGQGKPAKISWSTYSIKNPLPFVCLAGVILLSIFIYSVTEKDSQANLMWVEILGFVVLFVTSVALGVVAATKMKKSSDA